MLASDELRLERKWNKSLDPTQASGLFGGMVQRTRAQSITDDLAYPVRVKFRVPGHGLGSLSGRAYEWLDRELGRKRYAWHSTKTIGGFASAIYFHSAEDAGRFVAAFPEMELADGTKGPGYSAPWR